MSLLPFSGASLSVPVSVANGGTGSTTQNFVDLTTVQTVGGTKSFTNTISTTGALFASGSFNENTTTAGIYLGGPTTLGTPRFMLADGTANRNWEFDNNGGTFRAFTPGVVQWQTTLGGVSSFRDLLPMTNATNTLGNASFYWTGVFATIHNFNSTASISGATAGLAALTGNLSTTGTIVASNNNSVTATVPSVLSTTTGINAKSIAATTLYTVPTGKTCVVTAAIIRCTAASAITNGPTASIGFTSTAFADIYANANMVALTGTTAIFGYSTVGMSASAVATTVIKLNISTGAAGTSQTIAVDLIGYLF